ncbi:hypothetical protein QBC39DRAFT_151836 [Podospora conica]|nr:hypothetical protein QBC39DRAFT_151836 [Schizothecium conicum]
MASPSDPDLIESIQCLWPELAAEELMSDDYLRMLGFFRAKIQALQNSATPLGFVGWSCWLATLTRIRSSPDSSKQHIHQEIRGITPIDHISDAAIFRAINAAASLWLTLDLRSPSHHIPPDSAICWPEDQTLSAVISQRFQPMRTSHPSGDTTGINNSLTMAHLVSNYNFSISWSPNLAEHLIVDWDHKNVTIYEHKICLANHLRLKDSAVLPVALTEEAIDTLNLLFPFDHAPTESLLRKHRIPFYGLGYCGRPRRLELSKYPLWGARLEELSRVLDEPPVGLRQLGLGRGQRNLLQFATFWIAVTVAILTIVTFAVGVYSSVYAKKQYDLAVLQYKLSLAQVCLAPEAQVQLADFCP